MDVGWEYGEREGVKIVVEGDGEGKRKDGKGWRGIDMVGRRSGGCGDEEKVKEIGVMVIEEGGNIGGWGKNRRGVMEWIRKGDLKMGEGMIDWGGGVK